MFQVYWLSKRGRWHETSYGDAFSAMNAFRAHKRSCLLRNGVILAQRKAVTGQWDYAVKAA